MTTADADRELTLLLMLKDRVPFTLRWMSYAQRVRLPFSVFVADGGLDDGARQALADAGRFPNVAFQYVRYPADRAYADYYAKIEDALSQIRTPYVALSDNDDFWIVEGLRESLQFLRTHPEYATCGGQVAYFWVDAVHSGTLERSLFGPHVRWKCSRDPAPPRAVTASERIRTAYDVYYHVHRTADLHARFRAIRAANPADIVLVEVLLFLLTAISGPTQILDRVYLGRQCDSPDTVAGAHVAAHGDWLGRMLQPSWSEDVRALVETASLALARTDAIPLDEARARITQWVRLTVGQDVLTDLVQDREIAPLPGLLSLAAPAMLARLRRRGVLRDLARLVYRRSGWISYHAVRGGEWLRRRVSGAERDFEPVRSFLAAGATPRERADDDR